MKIGIDARMLGVSQTGIGLYEENLILNLLRLDRKNFYVLFLNKESSWFLKKLKPYKNIKVVFVNIRWYSFAEQILFPYFLYKEKLDLMHFLSFNAPLFYFKKRITTIHDITPRYFSKSQSLFKKLAFEIVFLNSIKVSQKIIAISHFTKDLIIKNYKVNPKKIDVIYHGIPLRFKKYSLSEEEQELKKLSLFKKKYILYTGVLRKHKNIEGLILAFLKLKNDSNFSNYVLVLAGEGDDPSLNKYKKIKDIKFLGFVSNKRLAILMKYTELFVFPSFVEGFGFPPLEALSFNRPVCVSDRGALKEVLGSAALYFNPNDILDISNKIKVLLTNNALKQEIVQNSKELLKKYKWEECANKTLELYKSIS